MRRAPFTLTSLITLVVIALLATVYAIALSREQGRKHSRVQCASTLRALGSAMKFYAHENRGQWPRAIFDSSSPTPTWGTPYVTNDSLGPADGVSAFVDDAHPLTKYRPAPNDVTAALYLLVTTQDISMDVLTCPSAKQTPMQFGEHRNALHWTNFPGHAAIARHLSYSYANPYYLPPPPPERPTLPANVLGAEHPLLSDMNPGTEILLQLTLQSSPKEMRAGNSLNHRGDGQNIVYADGHVEFADSPFAGVQRDNIYTVNGPERMHRTGPAVIRGVPSGSNDAVMLPARLLLAPK